MMLLPSYSPSLAWSTCRGWRCLTSPSCWLTLGEPKDLVLLLPFLWHLCFPCLWAVIVLVHGTHGCHLWLWGMQEHSRWSKVCSCSSGLSFPILLFLIGLYYAGTEKKTSTDTISSIAYRSKGSQADVQEDRYPEKWGSGIVVLFLGCLFRKAYMVPKDAAFDVSKILTRSNIGLDTEKKMVYVYCSFWKGETGWGIIM